MKTLTTLILTALLVLSTSAQARPETGSDSRQTLGGPGPYWKDVGNNYGGNNSRLERIIWMMSMMSCRRFKAFCSFN